MKLRLYGAYNRYGYTIFQEGGQDLYHAGNGLRDSTQVVDICNGLSLRRIRSYCISTGREMAAEMNVDWLGVERVDDDERLI